MTLSYISNLWRQKSILAMLLYLLDQLKVCGDGNVINYSDLDTIDDIIRRWNTNVYECILEADKYERPR